MLQMCCMWSSCQNWAHDVLMRHLVNNDIHLEHWIYDIKSSLWHLSPPSSPRIYIYSLKSVSVLLSSTCDFYILSFVTKIRLF